MAGIGQIIDGKFRILQPLGRGGMSRIYLAEDIRLGKRWVVKEIPKVIGRQKNILFIQAAISEAQIIKSLDHPAVVRIVDIIQDEKALYIVEDYVQGRSFQELAQEGSAIEPEDLKQWAVQLCQVLIYLHSRKPPVIYRDLKPENIILTDSGHIRLVDFGIARRYRPEGRRDTVYLGTVRFAAPEQFEEYGAQTDMRTDIYGFGKTLQYMAYFCKELSPEVYNLIDRCIEEDPQDRYQSGEELLETLEEIRYFGKHTDVGKILLRSLLLLSAAAVLFFAVRQQLSSGAGNGWQELDFLLDSIKADGSFSVQEEEQMLNLVMPHLKEWKEKEGFEQKALEIGELYWNSYEYGSGSCAGAEGALPWFELAGESDETARIYRDLAQFQLSMDRIGLKEQPDGFFREALEQLILLGRQAALLEGEDRLKALILRTAADSLTADIRHYRDDGAELSDVELLLTEVGTLLDTLYRSSEPEREQLQELEEKLERAEQAVRMCFPS